MKHKLLRFVSLYKWIVLSGVLVASPFFSMFSASATNPSLWTEDDPTWEVNENDSPSNYTFSYMGGRCENRDFTYSTGPSWNGQYTDNTNNRCFVDTPFGQLSEEWYIPPFVEKAGLYRGPTPVLIAGQSNLYSWGRANGYWGVNLYKHENVAAKLKKYEGSVNGIKDAYYLDPSAPDDTLKDNNGNPATINDIRTSPNGRWAIADTQNGVFLRINLDTFEILPFGTSGFINSNSSLAISNDGRYAFSDSYAWGSRRDQFFDLSGCASNPNNSLNMVSGCIAKDMSQFFLAHNSQGGGNALFNSDSSQLSLTVLTNDQGEKRVTLTAPGQSNNKLDYLALGDSFSSGEGETSDSHYLAGTNVEGTSTTPSEKCHISDRSYPFILSQQMAVSSNEFKSVACSGAHSYDVTYDSTAQSYWGQDERLRSLTSPQLDVFQNVARQSYIPGRVGQIEFVKTHKPKVLTLTMGGNDLGFADTIKACIATACDDAHNANQKRQDGQNIYNLYDNLLGLYSQLHQASPATKIYAIGYPKFIKEGTACAVNVRLDDAEREFINQATTYANSVIEAAAKKAGVKYIDISDSLAGHELCAGSADQLAVNGITLGDDENIPYTNLKWIGHESFHPSPAGQRLMATAIHSQVSNLQDYDYCPNTTDSICPDTNASAPELPNYFNTGTAPTAIQTLAYFLGPIGERVVQKGVTTLNAFGEMFAPGSNIHVEVHSDPISLGDYTTDSNGQISTQFTIPSTVPAGYHTIHMIGTSISGQQIDLYQPLTVVGADPNDIDEDGIANANDPCPFIQPANTDQDQDGTDDACDGYIEPANATGALYRARNGNAANGEDPNQVYLERNVAVATKELGYFDYDPDNDGWAVVAHSDNAATNGTFVKKLSRTANLTSLSTTLRMDVRPWPYRHLMKSRKVTIGLLN